MTFRDNVSAAIKAFRDAHLNADTDGDATAIHHTLGESPYQAAPGNHNHNADYSAIGHNHDANYSASGHNHDASYVAIYTEVGRISKNAQQNIANNTLTAITFQTAEKDTPAGFADTANNRLVIPTTGRYYVEAQLRWASAAGGDRWLGLALNGSYFKGAGTPTSVASTISGFVAVSFRYDFTAGDALTASGLQNSGAALDTSTANNNTYILAERVG